MSTSTSFVKQALITLPGQYFQIKGTINELKMDVVTGRRIARAVYVQPVAS